jgi:ankyrin repeat protein
MADGSNLLLEKRAEVNAKKEDWKTTLYMAAQNGNEDVVRLLLETGVDIEVRTTREAQHCTTQPGISTMSTPKVVPRASTRQWYALLLEKGADIEAMENRGRSALYNASRCQHREVV